MLARVKVLQRAAVGVYKEKHGKWLANKGPWLGKLCGVAGQSKPRCFRMISGPVLVSEVLGWS